MINYYEVVQIDDRNIENEGLGLLDCLKTSLQRILIKVAQNWMHNNICLKMMYFITYNLDGKQAFITNYRDRAGYLEVFKWYFLKVTQLVNENSFYKVKL